MYKVREQRLKEFYTTGEVLEDVERSTPRNNNNIAEFELLEGSDRRSLIPVATPIEKEAMMTHTDSIKDRGFTSMKSQEIHDSVSSSSNRQSFQGNGDADQQSYWKVESSSESYQAVGRDGKYEIKSQAESRNMAGENGRIVMDSGFGTESKSVIDRNGDVRVLSSRSYDTSGHDMSNQGMVRGDMKFLSNFPQSDISREMEPYYADFNDGNLQRYRKDVSGSQMVSSSVSGSKSSETRISSSSQVSQKWSTEVKTSSSTVTSSRSTSKESDSYYGKYDSSSGKELQSFDSDMQIPRKGVTEVKKTVIRGGKVITETIRYVDGKPVDGSCAKTSTQAAPPETITVIRGGKIIKEKVSSQTTGSQRVTTENQKSSTTRESEESVRSYTSGKITMDDQKDEDLETTSRTRYREPDSENLDSTRTPNEKPRPVNQSKAPSETKTVIRGGKVIKEKIYSDADDTANFIRQETSSTQETTSSSQIKRDSRTSESVSRRSIEVDDNRERYLVGDDQDYPDEYPASENEPHPERQTRRSPAEPDSKTRGQIHVVQNDSVYDRKRAVDGKVTSTKTTTIIRNGKVVNQTVEKVDEEQVASSKRFIDDDDNTAFYKTPSMYNTDQNVPKKSQYQDEPDKDRKSSIEDERVTVKTIKTVIRGGKLIKEVVPVDDDTEYVDRERRRKTDDNNQRPVKVSPTTGRPVPTEAKPTQKNLRDDRPKDEDEPQHSNKQRPTQRHPRDEPDDTDDDGSRIVKGSRVDVQKVTNQTSQKRSSETKTVTVIRGGKLIKEKIAVTDREDVSELDSEKNLEKPSITETPQKTRPATDGAGDDAKKPKKPSPETGSKQSPQKRPDKQTKRHPDYEVPSDKEGSDYPSGSEAPLEDQDMPYNVVTVIRSGKLVKEMVPISDDDVDYPGSKQKKPKQPSKDVPKSRTDYPEDASGRPSDIKPVQGIPSDKKKSPDTVRSTKNKKKPKDDVLSPSKNDTFGPGKKGTREDQPDDDDSYRKPHSPSVGTDFADEYPDDDTQGRPRPKDHKKPAPDKTTRDRKPSSQEEPEDDQPSRKSPGKDGKKSQKQGSPDKRKPGKPQESDNDETPVKTVTVIRGGKVVTETVKLTEEEIRERKMLETKSETTEQTSHETTDFIEAEKGMKPRPKQPKTEDHENSDVDRPNRDRSSPSQKKPDNLKTKDFIQKEKPNFKTVTVIRAGKLVKEVVPVDDDEDQSPEKGMPRDKATKRPERDYPDRDRVSPDDKPHYEDAPSRKSPQDGSVKGYPNQGERPRDDKSPRKPQDNQADQFYPDKYDDSPGKRSPGKSGKHPDENYPKTNEKTPQDGKPRDFSKKPVDKPGKRSPNETERRPEEDDNQDFYKRPTTEPDRYSPDKSDRHPDAEYPDNRSGRPQDNEENRPDKERKRPEDVYDGRSPRKTDLRPSQYPGDIRPQDDRPGKKSPEYPGDKTNRRPGEDHPKTTGKKPQDDRFGKPDDYDDDEKPDDYDDVGKKSHFKRPDFDKTGRKPDDARKKPSGDRPEQDDAEPRDRRPTDKHPFESQPGKQQPKEEKYLREKEFIEKERSAGMKMVSVIRAGKIVKELVPADDDESHPRKKPETHDKPDDKKQRPEDREPFEDDKLVGDKRRPKSPSDEMDRSPEDEFDRAPKSQRKPEDDQRTDGRKPYDDYSKRFPQHKEPDEVDDDRGDTLLPDGMSKRPRSNEPDELSRRPRDRDEDHPDSLKPDSRFPEKPGKYPDDRDTAYRTLDDFREPGRKPINEPLSKRPDDNRPQSRDRRPKDEPDSRPLDTNKRPNNEYPDDGVGKRYPEDTFDRSSPYEPGKRPEEKPEKAYPTKPGSHHDDDYPESLKPRDQRPEEHSPDRRGKRPESDRPKLSPDKNTYGRRPQDDYPKGVSEPDDYNDNKKPDQYSTPKYGKRPDQKLGKPTSERPDSNYDYPKDFTRRPEDGKPDSSFPKSEKPDQYGRRPQNVFDRLSPDSKRPTDDNERSRKPRPHDDYPDQFITDIPQGHSDDDEPGKLRRYPRDRDVYDTNREPRRKYTDEYPKRPEDFRKPGDKDSDDTSLYEPEDYTQWSLKSDKISVDVSASHAQFASSLRAPPLERPDTPLKPHGDQTPKGNSFPRHTTPKQVNGKPLKDSVQRPRGKYPQEPTPTRGTPQKPKSSRTNEPQFTGRGKIQKKDSIDRISQRSTEINAVINRLTSDTQSSKERRKQTSSRHFKSNNTKRALTPRVSPSTSPTTGKPRSDDRRKRTTSGSSTVSTEEDSDFNYQKPDRPDSDDRRTTSITEVGDFVQTERFHSRTVQKVQEDDDYEINSRRIRDRSPSDLESTKSAPKKPKDDYLDDNNRPIGKKPKDVSTKPKKTDGGVDDTTYDSPTRKKPSSRPEDYSRYPSKADTPNRMGFRRPDSPSDNYSPRDLSRSPRSTSGSPHVSPGRRQPSDRSPQYNGYPRRPSERSPDRKTKKPDGLSKTSPLTKKGVDRPKKEITEYPSQRRHPTKDELPQLDKTKPKKSSTQPVSKKEVPGTPARKRPDYPKTKPDTDRLLQKPEKVVSPKTKGVPDTKTPMQKKSPKTPSSLQPEKSKPGKPGVPSNMVHDARKPGKLTPTKDVMPRGRHLSDSEDMQKLNEFAAVTRHHTSSITTTTTVETKNFINSESGRRSSTRKTIMDFDWNDDTNRRPMVEDNSSVGSQENISPTGKPKKPSSPDSRRKRPSDIYPTSPSAAPKSSSDQPRRSPDDKVKPKKEPKRPGSESSENQSDLEIPMDVELIDREQKPQKLREKRYRDQIDLIRREQEDTYGTKVMRSVRDDEDDVYTGEVETPGSPREPNKSPNFDRLKCVPVNERNTEELRPRYADEVSEPEDESYPGRKTNKGRQTKPYDDEPKKSLRDMLVKSTLEKIDKIPDLCDIRDDTDETVNMSVAERVNKFMETALRPDDNRPSRPEDITLKGLDDTINKFIETHEIGSDVTDIDHKKRTSSSVIKAKTMFETIANETITSKKDIQRRDDILSEYDRKPDDEPSRKGRSPELYDSPKRKPGDRPNDRSPERYDSLGRKPNHQSRSRSPESYDKFGGKPTDRLNNKSPNRFVSPSRKLNDRPDDKSPERYGSPRRKPGDRPDDMSPDRYDSSKRKPGDRPSDRSPERYGSPRRKPGDRPDDRSPDRYDGSRKKPGDRPGDRSPDRYDSSRRKPGDRPDDKSPDRYDSSKKKPGDRPSDRSPERYGSPRRKPGDRPDDKSPERYGSPKRKPGDRPDDRYDSLGRKPNDKPGTRSPDRYDSPKRKPSDRPDDRYDSLRRKPSDKPNTRSPERYDSLRKKSGDQPSQKDRSPDRYDSLRRKPRNHPSDDSPERYDNLRRKPGHKPDDNSPEQYDSPRRKIGDRPGDVYDSLGRKPRDKPSTRSPERYDSPKTKPSERPGDRSPERYGSPRRKPSDRLGDRSPDRYDSPGRKPGDRPGTRSPERYDSLGRKPNDKSSTRSPDRNDSPWKRPSDKSPSKRPSEDKTPSSKHPNLSEKYDKTPKGKPINKATPINGNKSMPGSITKKPQQGTPRRPDDFRDTYSESVTQSTHLVSIGNLSPKHRSQSPGSYDTYSTNLYRKLETEDVDFISRLSPTRTTFGRIRSPDVLDSYRTDDKDYSPSSRHPYERSPFGTDSSPTSKYPRERSPFATDSTPSRPTNYSSPEPKKSPSRELADQVRRLSPSKKGYPSTTGGSKYPQPKTEVTKPLSTYDKYNRLDEDRRTITSVSTTKVSKSQISSSFPTRTTPEKRTKPLFDREPKTNGYLLPEDRSPLSPSEKTKKIPENAGLKAPALLKKQHSQPENLRYSTSVHQEIRYRKDYEDDYDDRETYPTLGSKPYSPNDAKLSKFGVTLKKTSSGTNFVRKGPVDVGKKETELDRTYDLDILNGMLERAKGYEERRLIRNQIRTVKTMIENNELTRIKDRKKPQGDDDYDLPYRPTKSSPLKSSPLDRVNGYEPDRYETHRTTERTTTETHSIRASQPDKYYPMKSTAALTLSPKSDSPLRRSPDKVFSSFPDKSYPRNKYGSDTGRPEEKFYPSDREPVGVLVDSETRKLLKRPDSPKKGPLRKPFQGDNLYSVSKTIRKEHETKETNLTDSIISSYGVGPTDDKGRPLFGLQALRRQKGKPDSEVTDFRPKETESPLDIKDSSGRAFFGLKALRAPKKDLDQRPESPTSKELMSTDGLLHRSLRETTLTDDSDTFIRSDLVEDDVNRFMAEPGQSLKDMIRKHERLMDDGGHRRPDKTTTSSSYSTSTVIRSSAVTRPDGTVSVKKNIIRGETTAKDDEEPRTRVTTEEYSYETPREPYDEAIEGSDVPGRRSIKSVTGRSSTNESLHDKYSRTSSSYKSTVDGTTFSDNYRPGTENGTNDGKRYSSSYRNDDSGFRRGSSTPIEDVKETLYRKFSGSEETEPHTVPAFARVGKGGSVKALSQKFQQAAAEAELPKSGVSSYPKAGLILRSTSFKQTNGELKSPDSPGLKQSVSMEVRVGSPGRSGSVASDYQRDRTVKDVGRSWSSGRGDRPDEGDEVHNRRSVTRHETEIRSESTGSRSFLGNPSKVTGVQDIISRMKAADEETGFDDSPNDTEARVLFNKFLGASAMMSGMEPLMKGSGTSISTLESQVERQRILDPLPREGYREITSTVRETRRSSDKIDDDWDEKKYSQLLDDCSDLEERRKLRSRLRTTMAEKPDSDLTSRTDSHKSSSLVMTSKTTYTTDTSSSKHSNRKLFDELE